MEMEPIDLLAWNLFVDVSSGEAGLGTRVVLVSLEGLKLNCAMIG